MDQNIANQSLESLNTKTLNTTCLASQQHEQNPSITH
jgi:hypothetical protein